LPSNMSVKEQKELKALTKEVAALGYRIIYEKGNFQSGYCMVLDKKVIVVNKFISDKIKTIILKELIQQISMEVNDVEMSEIKLTDE
jgi:hypothetical protein